MTNSAPGEPRAQQKTPRRRISPEAGRSLVNEILQQLATQPTAEAETAFRTLPRADQATAIRFLLEELSSQQPGNSVEVRVPPFGVTQAVAGPRHTRGTPPNVVEMTGWQYFCLATGYAPVDSIWVQVQASGVRADLRSYFPLV